MAHPYESAVKASNSRRLRALGAKAGKAHGSSLMFHAKSYPKKNAGTERPMTISGGTAGKRADRMPAKYADGGGVLGGGGGGAGPRRKGRRGGSTTNIVIAGGRGGGQQPQPVPVPVPRPVPVPVRPALPVAVAPRPAGPPGAPPVNVNMAAPAAGPPGPMGPAGPMPVRPPGMADGGSVKKKASGGAIRKRAIGGGLGGMGGGMGNAGGMPVGPGDGPGVRRGPVDPSTVQGVGRGPIMGLGSVPAPGPAGAGGQPPIVPLTGNNPTLAASNFPITGGGRPFGMKKGGKVKHDDEAQDKKLFNKMYAAKKKKSGGSIRGYSDGDGVETPEQKAKWDRADAIEDAGKAAQTALTPPTSNTGAAQGASAAASGAETAGARAAGFGAQGLASLRPGQPFKLSDVPIGKKGPQLAKDGGFVPKNEKSKDRALKASTYRQQGAGYNRGGAVKKAGSHSGLGRLAKISAARAVPAKTEI